MQQGFSDAFSGIVGRHAGELALPWVLSVSRGLGIGAFAVAIASYATFSKISKRAVGDFYTPKFFSRRIRALVRLLGFFG